MKTLDARKVRRSLGLGIILGVLLLLLTGVALYLHPRGDVNKVALADAPRGVTVVEAQAATFRPTRVYVGTVEPWVEARIGPQLVSAYVDTVLVRPGALVKRNDVLATLDCRNASAVSKSVAMQARALESTQVALTREASRVSSMLDGGFVSPNEVDQKVAESASKQSQLLALQAQMLGSGLQVADCVLRAPFDGEVGERFMDPGGYVRPGNPLLTIVDRRLVRVTADVPEEDFAVVAPGTPVSMHLLSTGQDESATISRRAPSADPSTRTVHVELDMQNPDRRMPVGTTAQLRLQVGEPRPATRLPLVAASVRGTKANIFTVEGDVAHLHTVAVLGEEEGNLYVDPSLPAGSQVVTEGRALLRDKDKVVARQESASSSGSPHREALK